MLGERIVKNAAQYPERIAICYGDQNYTYGELIQDIQETSTIIQELTKNRFRTNRTSLLKLICLLLWHF